LAGTVRDASGAILPKANVVIRNLDTGLTRGTTADNTGFWRVPALQPARYAVEVTAPSFGKLVRAAILVEPTVERTVDVTLSPGAVTEVISVTAEAPLIEQTKAQLSHAVSWTDIMALPTQDLTGLALLLPGSAPNAQGRSGSGFVINGGRTRSNNFMIDGANNNDQSLSMPRQTLSPEVLAEVRIITNNFSAEFGRNAASIVKQTTRSGTNELHGIVRWSWLGNGYNSLTTAQQRTFAAQKTLGLTDYDALRKSRGVEVRNQAVFSAGGPIRKDSTFFFSSYDFDLRRSTASPVAVTISPAGYQTLEQNKSLFASGTVDFLRSIYPVANDPTSRGALSVAVPGQTLTIPLQQFNRAAQGALPYARNNHRGLMKLDSRLTGRDNLSVRYAVDDDLDPGTPNALAVNQLGTAGRNQNGTINHVRVASPSLISEARAVYGRRATRFTENFPPQFSISGSGLPTIGNQIYPQFRTDNLYEFTNNWSWIRSRHSLRFGANFLRYQLNSFLAPAFMGVISYPSFADFLYDRDAQFSQYAGTGLTPARTSEFGAFVGDDWRVASSLTLNLGIRYEYVGAPFGYFSNAKPDINNFAPRFGFAWSPRKSDGWLGAITGHGKLAIRGGYAISYDQIFQNILLNNARNYPRGVSVALQNLTGQRTWDAASRPPTLKPEDFEGDPKLLPVRLFSPNKRIAQPYGQQFSFGIERQFYTSYALRVFYVGTHGVKLVREVEQNIGFTAKAVNANPSVYAGILLELQPVTNAAGAITQYQRDPTRGSILVGDGYAQSIYHSLQVTFAKPYRKSFGYTVNYTWSAFINDSDDILGGQANRTLPSTPFNLKLDRGRSGYDVPHRLVANYIYEFPLFRDRAGILGHLIADWSISGVTTLANGTPYSILNGNNALGILPGQISTTEFSQRANYNPSGEPGTGTSPTVTNPRFIANPTDSGIIGNLGANTERLGNVVSLDTAIVKKIKTWVERGHYIELRWEIFNALNHRNFDQVPANTVSNSTNLTLFHNLGQTSVSGRTFLWTVRYIF
jgi:outer membrane receptor protein involved in Fe transport